MKIFLKEQKKNANEFDSLIAIAPKIKWTVTAYRRFFDVS